MAVGLLLGDARHIPLPDESVQAVITSPPYWGLRDYQLEPLIWGGGESCGHQWSETMERRTRGALHGPSASAGNTLSGVSRTSIKQGQFCTKCGAWSGSLGLEPTPEMYVQHLVEVFREVWRVLRPDGVAWLNIGDSFFGANWRGSEALGSKQATNRGASASQHSMNPQQWRNQKHPALKPKDLVGVPWRVAFALQAAGWWVRSNCIWAKGVSFLPDYAGSCMPESVRDRPTTSHEHVFLLTKSARYYYDQEAVKEPLAPSTLADSRNATGRHIQGNEKGTKYLDWPSEQSPSWYRAKMFVNPGSGRNLRSVWVINPKPYKGAHFATFPPALIEPMVKASTSEKGCCPKCKAPWVRVLEKKPYKMNIRVRDAKAGRATPQEGYKASQKELADYDLSEERYRDGYVRTIAWRPSCKCNAGEPSPCLVLDPFAGSGTVGAVCAELGRDCVLLELAPQYLPLAMKRINGVQIRLSG